MKWKESVWRRDAATGGVLSSMRDTRGERRNDMKKRLNFSQVLRSLGLSDRREECVLFLHIGSEMYGADKIFLEMLRLIDRTRFKPVVILPEPGELLHHIRRLDIQVYIRDLGILKASHFTIPGRISLLFHIFRGLLSILSLSLKHRFLMIHSNTSFVLVGGLAARVLGIPHVWHIHEILTRPRMWVVFSYLIPRLTDVTIAVSEAVRYHLISGDERNEANTIVVHNGISPEPFERTNGKRVREEYGIGEDDILVGMVGRVNYWKGQETFLEVAAILLKQELNVRFLLVGGTHEGEEDRLHLLRRKIENEKMDDFVFISDFRNDIADVFAACDIFVVPSIQPDPFPTVALEAMCSGKPVVAFAFGGIPEMITHEETGLLVPPIDTRGMAVEIRRLIDNPDLRRRLGENGRERCLQHFTREAFIDSIESIFSTLIEND